uniref:Signal recognition particle 14 kDa protein n=2 Tax=Melopsittacus undulatus TaxID=13146 RepID=A0A8C6JHU4_MELUD
MACNGRPVYVCMYVRMYVYMHVCYRRSLPAATHPAPPPGAHGEAGRGRCQRARLTWRSSPRARPRPLPRLRMRPRVRGASGRCRLRMVLLESEQFLTELTRLFQKCRTSGSVFITLKKYDGRTKPVPRKGHVESFEPADNKCLLRATDGKKKISTVVSSKEVNKFQMAYSNLLRANMDGLKKKDKKSKNKKSKATQ